MARGPSVVGPPAGGRTGCLGMARAAVIDLHTQPHQPRLEFREVARAVAPRLAVVAEEGRRQAVDGEGPFEGRPHLAAGLAAAGFQQEVEAAVVVEHGQGVAGAAVAGADPALEVHLPEFVGGVALEAPPPRAGRAGGAF